MVATATRPAAPPPAQGEAYAAYVVRAHQALMQSFPEPMERNQVVWDAWSAAHGSSDQDRADQFFTADKYEKRPNACYFAEHEAVSKDAQGNPIIRRYDAAKLGEIVTENNFRIADRDAYPTIIDRHTAGSGMRDPSPPRTLGAAGPLRLGMLGRVQPCFAIFADEYVRRECKNDLADRPGRSVEVLTLKANGRTYINPIAAISEAPRLPLPVQFSFGQEEGEVVERYQAIAPYSVAAAAFPGGGNTFTQKFDTSSPDGDGNQSSQPQESGPMLQDQDIRQIVEAIMNTDQMKWVAQQMQTGGTPAGGAPPEPEPMPMNQPSGGGTAPPQTRDQFGGMGSMSPMGGMAGRYAASEDVETLQEQYSAIVESQRELINELAETRAQLEVMATERADAVRMSRIHELAGRYAAVDVDSELESCLYSHGSTMDDNQFEHHLGMVERYAAKAIEQMPMVPQGQVAPNTSDRESAKYRAQESAEIMRLANQYANQGVAKPYDELKREAQGNIAH